MDNDRLSIGTVARHNASDFHEATQMFVDRQKFEKSCDIRK